MDIKKIATIVMALMLTLMALPCETVEAREVSREEQIVFLKGIYVCTKEMGQKYQIPYQAGLATFCWESGYGTGYFARMYNNISGVGCLDENTCTRRYASREECIEDYFKFLADEYKLRGIYGDPSALLRASTKTGFNPYPGYADDVCGMLREVQWLEGEVVAALEADAEAERRAAMEDLADELVSVMKEPKADKLRAGAVMAMHPRVKQMTVREAAAKLIKGKLGDGDARRKALGRDFRKVQEYVEYVTVPNVVGV